MAELASGLSISDSVKARDPAAWSRWETIYPGVWALVLPHRALAVRREALFPGAAGESFFAGDYRNRHPSGAKIGELLYDYGFSVIGETAEIGDDVTIYRM
jgi:serine O-acetyltransferase